MYIYVFSAVGHHLLVRVDPSAPGQRATQPLRVKLITEGSAIERSREGQQQASARRRAESTWPSQRPQDKSAGKTEVYPSDPNVMSNLPAQGNPNKEKLRPKGSRVTPAQGTSGRGRTY